MEDKERREEEDFSIDDILKEFGKPRDPDKEDAAEEVSEGLSGEMDEETAEEAIFAAEEEIGSSEERLERIIELRYKNQLTDEKNSKKVINSLFRLGYGYDMIKDAIYKVKEEIADELYGNE